MRALTIVHCKKRTAERAGRAEMTQSGAGLVVQVAAHAGNASTFPEVARFYLAVCGSTRTSSSRSSITC